MIDSSLLQGVEDMDLERHLRALERMYHQAACNRLLKPLMRLERGRARVTMEVGPDLHHSGGGVHGHIIFKMLDDASFFAANTLFTDFLLVTAQFNLYFIRPVAEGVLTAYGTVKYRTFNLAVAEAEVINENGKEIAKGSGLFYKSSKALNTNVGYIID